MLRRLVKLLRKIFQQLFGKKKERSTQLVTQHTVVQSPPMLTNADLEYLFTQLLEGVCQARGQTWAIKFLERMENRISEQRWLEWLQVFGERLLASPAPNEELAFRLVQLGELQIGTVGDFAHDIGMRLLARNSGVMWQDIREDEVTEGSIEIIVPNPNYEAPTLDEDLKSQDLDFVDSSVDLEIPLEISGQDLLDVYSEDLQEFEQPVSTPSSIYYSNLIDNTAITSVSEDTNISFSDTPGQGLLRQFGEDLWGVEPEPMQPQLTNNTPITANDYASSTTDDVEDAESLDNISDLDNLGNIQGIFNTSGQDLLRQYGEELWESEPAAPVQPIVYESNLGNEEISSPPEVESDDFSTLLNTPGQDLISELGENLWSDDTEVTEVTEVTEEETAPTANEWTKIIDENYDENYIEFRAPEASLTLGEEIRTHNFNELLSNDNYISSDELDLSQLEKNDTDSVSEETEVVSAIEDIRQNNQENEQNIIISFDDTHELNEDPVEVFTEAFVESTEQTEQEIDLDSPIIPVQRDLAPSTQSWDDVPLADMSPTVAVTLDELWVRLQQSANLVEQLASGLLSQANTSQIFVDLPNQASKQLEAQAWFYQALAQTKAGNLSAAIFSYDQAIALAPDAYEYWFNRGLALFHLKDLPMAIASYENAIAIKPDYYKAWFNRGASLGELERYDEAIASFDKAIEIRPDYGDAWASKGLALLKLWQIPEAISCYDRATQLEPMDPENWYYRGVALSQNKQYLEAITSLEEAIEIQPQHPGAWYQRGLAMAQLEKWEDAVISYQKALKSHPGSYELWYLRGVALDKCNRHEDAVESYDNALALNPEFYEIWIDRGVLQASLGEWREAIASWDKALDINPNVYLAWFNKAIAWEQLGEREQAIACYDQTVDREPNLYAAWYNRGLLLMALSKFEDAILSFDYAIQLLPDSTEAWIARANAVEKSTVFDYYLSSHSLIANQNPSLNARGEEGKLATYAVAINYINKDANPEVWGKLHISLGNAYYDRGKRYTYISDDWSLAIYAYNQALSTVASEQFLELHLEVLQNIVRVLLGFGDTAQAQQFQTYAATLLSNALNDSKLSDDRKKELALKFAGLGQLAVDIAVQSGELVQALELAEFGKNACLNWLQYGFVDKFYSPSYKSIQNLVNPFTAIVYWHISPSGLRSFIVKNSHPEPILVFTPMLNIGDMNEIPIPEVIENLTAFEDWVKEWNQQYQDFRNSTLEQHSWLYNMEARLLQLRDILSIGAIEQELEGISKLILIPHRDLFRYPLHALFSVESVKTITYLPCAELGLVPQDQPVLYDTQSLLSIEALSYSTIESVKIETEGITNLFSRVKRLQTTKVTKQEILQELENHSILHFTGYTIDNPNNPKKSQLFLAEEDKLSLEEINHRILSNYYLITLSAGETIITTDETITTEYVGIVSGFLKAGVNHIVTTQWMVDNTANALVMTEFYRRLKQGKSVPTALNEAITWLKELTAGELKRWYEDLLRKSPLGGVRVQAPIAEQLHKLNSIAANQKLYNHPYYWAAFKVIGNLD
ncbi:MAG: tetratricopeptide repeat protein [Calothrix sp. C42_A2020_038]|nr:tetratricopeptide repeat protein [Calothrix sp. C42_A2020_038]